MKVLFITRKYPPSTGGMQQFSFELLKNYTGPKRAITLGKGQIHLIWWLPYVLIKSIYLAFTYKFDVIHLGDAVLAPIGYIIKLITRKKVFITAHGLDITYHRFYYQTFIPFFIKKADKIICVSNATKDECLKRKIDPNKLRVIPNGIDPSRWDLESDRENIRKQFLKNVLKTTNNKIILLSVGRFTERKGFDWFINTIMPKLSNNYIYVLIGSDDTTDNSSLISNRIKSAIQKHGIENQIFQLGRVSEDILKNAYLASDVFIMPNRQIEGDMEGFGIVVIEAGIQGTPTIAPNMEGLSDSVKHNENGILFEYDNDEELTQSIYKATKMDRNSIKRNTIDYFSWVTIAQDYENTFNQ